MQSRLLPFHPFSTQEDMVDINPLWELLSSTTLWVIWKSRCGMVMEGKHTPPVEAVKDIWSIVIHTLKGRYDSIKGDSENALKQRLTFHQTWYELPCHALVHRSIQWKLNPLGGFSPHHEFRAQNKN